MWFFSSASGRLSCDGVAIATGYSGHGPGKNNPADDAIPNVGPIPTGLYHIGPAQDHPHLGPLAMPLTPAPGNQEHGRAGFWIHGDSIQHPGQGSQGCICLPHHARLEIALSRDTDLTVTTGT